MNSIKAVSLIAVTCGISNAGVIYVDSSATGADDGSSWTDAYDTLQEALDAASFGDEIWVAEGEFFPSRQASVADPINTTMNSRDATFWIPRGVKLYGGFVGSESTISGRPTPLASTVLNGNIGAENDETDNAYRVVFYRSKHGGSYGTSDTDQSVRAVIDGFKVINAYDDSATNGGGLYITGTQVGSATVNASFDILNLFVQNNYSDNNGGGVAAIALNGDIRSCIFDNNESADRGGGVRLDNAANGPKYIIDCVFTNNTSASNGGGINIWGDSSSTVFYSNRYIVNCVFGNNHAKGNGGGVFFSNLGDEWVQAHIANTLFYENTTTGDGGAVHVSGGTGLTTFIDVRNSTFADNTASGDGGGISIVPTSDANVYNSIFWGNTATNDNQMISQAVTVYSCVEGGYSGAGNISSNPIFLDAANDVYSLRNDSPALDAARNTSLPDDVYDLDEDSTTAEYLPLDLMFLPRRIDAGVSDSGSGTAPIVDMGAYERCSADMDRDGDLDSDDVDLFYVLYGNSDPDADINGDGTLDFYDASEFTTVYNGGCGL